MVNSAWFLRFPSTASLALRQSYCFQFLLHWTDVSFSWFYPLPCTFPSASQLSLSFLYRISFAFSFQFPFTFVPSQCLRLLALRNPLYPKKESFVDIFLSHSVTSAFTALPHYYGLICNLHLINFPCLSTCSALLFFSKRRYRSSRVKSICLNWNPSVLT
jgi:hypothetical protein